MTALRYAARRVLGGQAPRPVYRAAFAEERRRLSPAFISAAHPRRFSSQGDDDDPLTFEEKMRLYKRGAHLIFRLTKAVSGMVACGMIIKWSLEELFHPYPTSKTALVVRKCREMLQGLRGKPPALEVGSLLGNEMVAAELAEIKSELKDAERRAAERLED